jgi:type IV secretion system protein VirD4
MLGTIITILLGLWIAGIVSVPLPTDSPIFQFFFGDFIAFGAKYGINAALRSAAPWIGWGLVALAVLRLRSLIWWPIRHAYWLRRLFGGRVFGKARWARKRDLHRAGLTRPGGLFLGNVRGLDLYHNGEGHLITIGGTGGGKSSGLVVPTLCELTEGAVIVTDPSGELAAMTARRRAQIGPVVFLNPFASVFEKDTGLTYPDDGFNPLSVLDPKSPNFITDTSALARLLMVGDRRESGSYWNDEGAEFLALMIASIKLYDPPDLHNLAFLYRVVRDTPENIEQRLHWIEDEGHPALQDDATRFAALTKINAQWAGVVSKAALATKRYAPSTPLGEHVGKDGFNAARLKTEKVTVFILVPPSMLAVALPWLNTLIGVFGMAIGQPGPRSPVTMLIDEAPSLGFLPDLRAHMAQLRKVGLRVWLFTQTYAALAGPELYGSEGMKELMGLCNTKQFFAVDEAEMQKLVSELAGQRSVSNPSSTGSTGDVSLPLIRPDEVRGLKQWHQIIIRSGLRFPIRAKLVPYFTRPKWRALIDPNPYRK